MPIITQGGSPEDSEKRGRGATQGGASVGHPINVATGAAFADYDDIEIDGRFPLIWSRHFSTDLLSSPTPQAPFGPGWYSPWFATLTRIDKEFRFRTPQGSVILLPDPDGAVDKDQVVRNLGTFTEIRRQGVYYRVTQWSTESFDLKCFIFLSGRNGLEWPLRFLENGVGDGVELAWDDQGRLRGMRQKTEKRTLAITLNPGGKVAAVAFRHPDGRQQTLARYEYDAKGRLAAAFDALGAADRYQYDSDGRIVREIVKDGGVFDFKFDEKGRCIRATGIGRYDFKALRYFDNMGITQVTDSHGHARQYRWLPTGQVIEEIGPRGGSTKTEYDALGRIAAVIDPLGKELRYAFDDSGNRVSIKHPDGETKIEFDGAHRPLLQVTAAGSEFKREYDASGRLRKTVDPAGTVWEYTHDPEGNLVKLDMAGAEMTWSFGPNGLLLEERNAEGQATHFQYDEFGRLLARTGPSGGIRRYRYDDLGQVVEAIGPDGSRVSMAYDAGGNLISKVDGMGNGSRYQYGPCARLLSITDALGRTTRLLWDTEPGRLVGIINPKGEAYRFFHDAEGNLVKTSDFAGVEKRYEYNPGGRPIACMNALGERIGYQYNAAGRLTGIELPDGGKVEYAFDKAGFLVKAACPDAVIEVEKDVLGRTLKESSGDAWVSYAYTPQGRVSRLESSLGLALDYAYSPRNFLMEVRQGGAPLIALQRDAQGSETGRDLPGGLRMVQQVDTAGRMLAQDVFAGGGVPVVSRKYLWNGVVVTGIRDAARGGVDYGYDVMEQLLRATRPGKAEHAFQYDVNGNILSARNGNRQEEFRLAPGDRLLQRGGVRYEYDRAGRLIRKTESTAPSAPGAEKTWSYTWDALDQLRELTTPEGEIWKYKYDPMGRRISKEGPSGLTRFQWDRETVLHDQAGSGRPRAWIMDVHTFKPFGRILDGEFCPLVTDHLGTPREMLDAEGNTLWSAVYGPYGDVEEESRPENRCPIRFQGQWLDEESGLHYNRYRYYDPEMGRYVIPDPVGLSGGMNAYRYTPNPVNWIDPLGLDWNYVLVDQNGDVYYTGVASDNDTACGVQRRHHNNPPDAATPRFDSANGDKMYQISPKGTDHETARGLEQRVAADQDLVIGRRGSETNQDGSVRGNLQNPVNQDDSNKDKRDSRAKKADDFLQNKGVDTDQLIADAIEKGPLKCK